MQRPSVISVMVAVPDAPAAVAWYKRALGAVELWNLGSVAGLEITGAPFFVGEPANNGWESPMKLGMPSVRVEVFATIPTHSSPELWRRGQTAVATRFAITQRRGERTAKEGSWIPLVTSGSSAIGPHWLATAPRGRNGGA